MQKLGGRASPLGERGAVGREENYNPKPFSFFFQII